MSLKKSPAISGLTVLLFIIVGIVVFLFSEAGYLLLAIYKYGIFGDAAKPVPNLQPIIIGISLLLTLGPLILYLKTKFAR